MNAPVGTTVGDPNSGDKAGEKVGNQVSAIETRKEDSESAAAAGALLPPPASDYDLSSAQADAEWIANIEDENTAGPEKASLQRSSEELSHDPPKESSGHAQQIESGQSGERPRPPRMPRRNLSLLLPEPEGDLSE